MVIDFCFCFQTSQNDFFVFQAAKLEYISSSGVWARVRQRSGVMGKHSAVLDVPSSQEGDTLRSELGGRKEDEAEVGDESEVTLESGAVLHMEGDMQKKSPAHNLWQGRYFKLVTKHRENDLGGVAAV